MREQSKNLWQEIMDVVCKLWSYVIGIWNWLSAKPIKKILGLTITVVACVLLVVECIVALLVLADPQQTASIIQIVSGIDIFSYINLYEYYGFFLGGVVLDIVLITLFMWWGIYWYCGTNYFNQPDYAWLYASMVGSLGLFLLITSVFYMAPDLAGIDVGHKHHHTNYRHEYYYPNIDDYYKNKREIIEIQRQIHNRINQDFWYLY